MAGTAILSVQRTRLEKFSKTIKRDTSSKRSKVTLKEMEVCQEAEDTIGRLNAKNKAIGPMRLFIALTARLARQPERTSAFAKLRKGEAVPLASDAIVPASEVEEKEEEKETRTTSLPSLGRYRGVVTT